MSVTVGHPGTPSAGTEAAIVQAAARIAAAGESRPRAARDPVNLPMIRNWAEAIGDANPVYTDAEAAAAVGARRPGRAAGDGAGLDHARAAPGRPDDDDPLGRMSAVLDEAGFTSVVATNCEQEYHRYLRHGEQVAVRARLESVTGPKRTALGDGWFVTTRSTWYVGTEPVASMLFRILKFRPPAPAPSAPVQPASTAPAAADVLRPVVSPDTAFFWDGTAAGELRIQRCGGCGALRHPPGPMCPALRRGPARVRGRRRAPARCTATWCSTTRRCRASSCRSWSRWWRSPRASAWSASCSA